MREILRQHIINKLGEKAESLEFVLDQFEPIEHKRNSFLLKEGEVCKHVFFLAKGCLQVFGYDTVMNETTRDLVIAENWCSDLISFGNATPSSENIRTVEPCQLMALSRNRFQQLLQTIPPFGVFYKQLLESSYANSVYRINTLVSMTALERIRWLMDNRPNLMTRVPARLIASYLGISQETFSRLRGKM